MLSGGRAGEQSACHSLPSGNVKDLARCVHTHIPHKQRQTQVTAYHTHVPHSHTHVPRSNANRATYHIRNAKRKSPHWLSTCARRKV